MLSNKFQHFSAIVENAIGSPWAFALAVASIIAWLALGPYLGFSDSWQLVCNTATTVVTYLLVFIIQASQTRSTTAIQLKLDELIRVTGAARNELIAVEDKNNLDELREDMKNA